MGGFLGRVSHMFVLSLQGVCIELGRTGRIFGTRGKSAFETHRAKI